MIKIFTCYDSINITFWKWQNYRDGEGISGYQRIKIREGRLVGVSLIAQGKIFVVIKQFHFLTVMVVTRIYRLIKWQRTIHIHLWWDKSISWFLMSCVALVKYVIAFGWHWTFLYYFPNFLWICNYLNKNSKI